MPKREKVDQAEIVAVYAELKNGMEVARRLGLSETTVYKVLRIKDLKCARCGGQPRPGQMYCDKCREHMRLKMAEKRALKLRAGKCQECDLPVAPPSRSKCAIHRVAAIERNARWETRLKRGAPNSGISSEKQRRRSIRKRYGEAGVAAHEAAKGCCEVCARGQDQTVIHIHHVDENPENNVRQNLAVLCFDCHQATHRLLVLKARGAFLSWFAKRYATTEAP